MAGVPAPVIGDEVDREGSEMTVAGTWVLTLSTAYGRHHVVIHLEEAEEPDAGPGGGLRGHATGDGYRVALESLVWDGDRLSWSHTVTGPDPVELHVEVKVNGEIMVGATRSSQVPPATVIGTRTAAPT